MDTDNCEDTRKTNQYNNLQEIEVLDRLSKDEIDEIINRHPKDMIYRDLKFDDF
ncbi:TPA: hypothetical protein ACXK4S_000692 [Pseudomonas aeruginosa]